jgi:CubicO group peptidase (beta-lactamase class C family)
MRIAAAALILVLLAGTMPARSAESPRALTRADAEAWLEGFLPFALAQGDIAGAAVVIVKDGAVLAARGCGFADRAAGTRVDPERTLFRTGSVGKLFTWTAVMQQVEAGRLDLDRDVNDYLDFRIPPRDGQPVTLRNLMTHTPGFEEAIKRLVTDRPERLASPEEYLKAWVPARIYPPGEVPAYSNYGVTLAGYLVERVSGEAYDDYVDRHVFAPLGMTSSTTRQVLPEDFRAGMSRGYLHGSGPAYPFELFGVSPAGGASTTVADMARFMIAWLQEGELAGQRILAADTARRALATRLAVVPPLNGMTLGFFEQGYGGRRIVGHGGDSQYFHSVLSLYPDEGVGVYLVMNSTGRDGAAGTVRERFMSEFADRYFPEKDVEGEVPAATAAEHVRLMAGIYMSSRGQTSNFFNAAGFLSQLRVTRDADGGLLVPALRDVNGEPIRWREVSPFVWQQLGGKERLAARIEDGRVAYFSVDSVSPFLVMLPAPWWKSSAIFTPLLAGAIAVLLVALLAWPVTALLRRHYRLRPVHAGAPGRPWRITRIAAAGALAAVAAWTAVFVQLNGNLFAFSPAFDAGFVVLKLATAIVCGGGLAAALLDARRGWSERRWVAKAGSLLLVLAFAILAWLAVVLRLAGYGVDY